MLQGAAVSNEELIALSSCVNKVEVLRIPLYSAISIDAFRSMTEAIRNRIDPVIRSTSALLFVGFLALLLNLR